MRLSHYSHTFTFPPAREPEWAGLVERWYQLDAPAFGVTEVYWRHRESLGRAPAWIFLCSPGASNATDAQFANNPQPSPAKFVHTLPNIRSAALLQVMSWAGPVLCLQNDPNTILSGLREALTLSRVIAETIWVVCVTGEGPEYRSHIFSIGETGHLKIEKSSPTPMAKDTVHDKHWLSWISNKNSQPFHGNGLRIE